MNLVPKSYSGRSRGACSEVWDGGGLSPLYRLCCTRRESVDNRKMVQRQTSEGTATQRNGGTMGGSKCTNNSQPSWYKWCRLISRPHRLKKTSSKQSKRRVQHLKWLHRETTIIHYNIPFFLSIFSLFCYREMRIHHFPFCPVVSSLHQIKYFFSSIQSKLLVNVCQNRKQYLG